MSKEVIIDSKQAFLSDRVIDTVEGDLEGPTFILISGVHGNETAGVQAVTAVLNNLQDLQHFTGKIVGVKGNLNAIRQNVRYVDEDMNRLWFPSIIRKVRETPDSDFKSSERRELKHLMNTLVKLRRQATSPLIIIDVHTFSSDGCMFALANDHPVMNNLLDELRVPKVYGILEALHGTALGYLQEKGILSLGLEGGQHFDEVTCYNIKAALMLMLSAAGCIDEQQMPELSEYRDYLQSNLRHLPEETELVYQHIIEPGDRFRMRPGYNNFQPIRKGEWLAEDREGKITAEINGYMLMPLYQQQGNDGFFIIKEHEVG